MKTDDTIYGPNRELNEKVRNKIFKVYKAGLFEVKIPVDVKNVPEEELEYFNSQLSEQEKKKI
jgi:hypothetical protein